MVRLARLAIVTLTLAGCSGDDGPSADAAPPDPCMPEMQFTGEYVDWDSTSATFMGVYNATFTLQGDPAKTDTTAPNGRFEMCIAPADGLVDVTPAGASTYVAGIAVANKAVIQRGAMLSYRSFTAARAADFSYDAAKAQVFVHVHGDPKKVSLAAAHAPAQVFTTTWAVGDTGNEIYFPNVEPSATTTLTAAGTTGAGSIPLAAGRFTYVTLIAN